MKHLCMKHCSWFSFYSDGVAKWLGWEFSVYSRYKPNLYCVAICLIGDVYIFYNNASELQQLTGAMYL